MDGSLILTELTNVARWRLDPPFPMHVHRLQSHDLSWFFIGSKLSQNFAEDVHKDLLVGDVKRVSFFLASVTFNVAPYDLCFVKQALSVFLGSNFFPQSFMLLFMVVAVGLIQFILEQQDQSCIAGV